MASVIIPCHLEPIDAVRATVDSARSVPGVDRVILVDDGTSRADLDDLDVTVVRCPENRGPGPAINAALSGLNDDELVCRLDCRDSFVVDAKVRQIAATRTASFSFARGLDATYGTNPNWATRIYTDNQFASSSIVFRVGAWRAVAGYPEQRWAEDWWFALSIQKRFGWERHPELTALHHEHPGGLSDVSHDPDRKRARDADVRRTVEYARCLLRT